MAVILCTLAVMGLSPGLKNVGIDAGLYVATHLNLAFNTKLPLSPRERDLGITGYVFVDLDAGTSIGPERNFSGAMLGCQALQKMAPRRYIGSEELQCGEDDPLNRTLLAEAVKLVDRLGAKALVIDVELKSHTRASLKADDERLLQAMAALRAPTKFVLSTSLRPGDSAAGLMNVQELKPRFHTGEQTFGLPIEMTPGSVARSFPDCYALLTHGRQEEIVVPNLPRAVAASLLNGAVNRKWTCEHAQPQGTRIVYSLPFTGVDVDRRTAAGNDPRLLALQAKLNSVSNHCLVSSLFDAQSHCSTAEFFAGKIVVLGGSAPYRGDWHYTPIGDMPGSLIVINAIRSVITQPDEGTPHIAYKAGFKIVVMLLCSALWFAFWAFFYVRRQRKPVVAGAERFARRLLDGGALCATVVAVLVVSYLLSYSKAGPDYSLDVLLPGLTVGLEAFVEAVKRGVDKFEEWVGARLHWEGLH